MKKLIALLLALVMALGLAACSSPTGDKTSDGGTSTSAKPEGNGDSSQPAGDKTSDTDAASGTKPEGNDESGQPDGASPLEGKHIGLLIYSTTTPWAMNIIDTTQSLCDSLGMKLTVAEAGTPNDVITGAENLLSANIDGMLCAMDGGIANKVMELTESHQVYTTFTFTNILEEEYYDQIADSEYYAGSINSQDFEAAYDMTQHCIDMGADKWVYLGMPEGAGPSIDARADGFKACLADNNLELLSEARTFDKVEGAQNLITNFPQLNGFGSGNNAAKNASGALESAGKMGSVYMFCFEAAESYVQEYFDNGSLHGCADGVVGHVELALAQLCNALTGNMLLGEDGRAVGFSIPYIIAYDSDDFSALIANSYDGNMIFNLDELKNLITVFNPDATADTMRAAVDAFSIEDLLARRA